MEQIRELLQLTTNRLVAINVLAFVLVEAFFAGQRSGLELYFWQNQQFHIWQLFTHMFLHGSWSHLAFNMLGLWSFGRILEQVWGAQRFLIFYLLCGLGAAVIHLLVASVEYQQLVGQFLAMGFSDADVLSVVENSIRLSTSTANEVARGLKIIYHVPTVGASGAIYGILVAFAILFPNFKIVLIFLPIPIAAKYFVPVLLLIDLTAGITGFSIFGSNIAHFAHIGGAVVGFLLVWFWLRTPRAG